MITIYDEVYYYEQFLCLCCFENTDCKCVYYLDALFGKTKLFKYLDNNSICYDFFQESLHFPTFSQITIIFPHKKHICQTLVRFKI